MIEAGKTYKTRELSLLLKVVAISSSTDSIERTISIDCPDANVDSECFDFQVIGNDWFHASFTGSMVVYRNASSDLFCCTMEFLADRIRLDVNEFDLDLVISDKAVLGGN